MPSRGGRQAGGEGREQWLMIGGERIGRGRKEDRSLGLSKRMVRVRIDVVSAAVCCLRCREEQGHSGQRGIAS